MSKQESVSKTVSKGKEDSPKMFMEKIQRCQKDITDFRNKCDKEIFEIERKYIKAVTPHLKDRNALIQNVPNFWAKALGQHPLLSTIFEPGEKEILKHLTAVDIEDDLENPDYFKIHFFFNPNPFFENRVLTKQFSEEGSASTTIKWKTSQTFPKSSKHDVWEYDELGLEQKGFFRWFSDPEEQFCDPIADIIRCHIWYDPLEFYFDESSSGDEKKSSEEVSFR